MPEPTASAASRAALLARAACLTERGRAPFPSVATRPEILAERQRRWQRATGLESPEFAALLRARGLEPDTALGDVQLLESGPLPAWCLKLDELLAGLSEPALALGSRSSRAGPFPGALDPLLATASLKLDAVLEHGVLAARAQVEDAAREGLLRHLRERLTRTVGPTLAHRLGLEDALEGGPVAVGESVYNTCFRPGRPAGEAWLATFAAFPVLARLVSGLIEDFVRYVGLLVERLAQDRGELESQFAEGQPLGPVRSIEPGAGDPHERAQTVTRLEFGSGVCLYYKPRDLRVARCYQELVDELGAPRTAASTAPRELTSRRILVLPTHAYEPQLERRDASSPAQVAGYYRRLGFLLGVLQLCEGRDFSAENLLACGDEPVPLDLEGLFAPRHRLPDAGLAHRSEAERLAEERLEESPAHVGILPLHLLGEAGRRGLDLSALASPGLKEAPFDVASGDRRLRILGSPAWLAGQPIDAGPYLDELSAGYAASLERLARAAPRLRRVLDRSSRLLVRYYHRDTSLYDRLIEASLAPDLLRDALERDLLLERLFKAHALSPLPHELVEQEIEACRRLDVPLLRSEAGGDVLVLEDGRRIGGYFEGSAIARTLARLARLEAGADTSGDRAIVESAAATRLGFPGELRPGMSLAPRQSGRPRWDWLRAACGIGDEILASAIRAPDRSLAWPGLAYHPQHDLWRLERLGHDVLSGTGGIGLALAALAHASSEPRYAQAATQTLLGLGLDLAPLAREHDRLRARAGRAGFASLARDGPVLCGGLYGAGSAIYALTRGARLLGSAALDELAERYTSLLDPDLLAALAPSDLVCGRAGLVLALVDPGDAAAPEPRLRLARKLEASLASRPTAESPYPPDASYLEAVPGPSSAARLAARRLGLGASEAWHAAPVGPGELFAALALADRAKPLPEGLATALEAATGGPPESRPSPRLQLALRLSLVARDVSGDSAWQARAEQLAAALLERREAHGSAEPELRVRDEHQLSAFCGLGALALALLRVAGAPAPVLELVQ